MNIFQLLAEKFQQGIRRTTKPTPAEFRRGYRKHRIIGYVADPNSKHPGLGFQGKVTPMRRRRKGVSLTAGK